MADEVVACVVEEEFAFKAVLIDPDGKKYDKSALDPEKDLTCAVFQESLAYDDQQGVDFLTDKPVAVFRNRSLSRMPKDGEKWILRVQKSIFSEDLTSYTASAAGSTKRYKTIGFTAFTLQSISQI